MPVTFTLHRSGLLESKSLSTNQCRSVGHDRYWYEAEVHAGPRLDDDGFIVDHATVNEVAQTAFGKGMTSCEMIGERCARAIMEACESHGTEVSRVVFRIGPVVEGDRVRKAFMEVTLTK